MGKMVFDLIPESQREIAKQRFGKRFDNPDAIARFERKYVCKDGSEIDLYIEDRIDCDENGTPVFIRATLQDISGLKNAQKELLFERSLLETLLNNIPDMIFFKDRNDRYIRVSNTLARMLGKTASEVVGKTVDEIVTPDRAAETIQNDQLVILSGTSIIDKEEYQPTPDGGERWLSTTKLPWYGPDGEIIGMFGIAHDITVRKKYAQMVEHERSQYRDLYDNAPIGYQEIDRAGIIVKVNRTEAEMLGYTVDELIGKNVFELIPLSQREQARLRFGGRFERPDVVGRFERKYLRKDGSEIDLFIVDRIVRDEHGVPVILRTTLQDISELKLAQEELQKTIAVKERIEGELEVAHDIQVSMLPRTFPPFPERKEFELYALLKPAKEVGGDFYDFFFIDENHLCFCIGDVSGKGVPASLYMAVTRTLIKSKTSKGLTPDQVLARVNEDLSIDSTAMFVTIFCGILDVTTGILEYSNGGHNPPLISRQGNDFEWLKIESGIAVGAVQNAEYSLNKIDLVPGDRLFLYTDGVTEAANLDEELYSTKRLQSVLTRYKNYSVNTILERVSEDVRSYTGRVPQSDDITMLMIRFNELKQQ
jgi:PAS domain S-box-containing protein